MPTFWRWLALASLSISSLLAVAIVWIAFAYKANLKVLADGNPVCLADYRKLDSVAAAAMIGRLDLVSFVLTVGGLLLAIFAFTGFWMIRREALDEAGRVATEAARKAANEYFKNETGTEIDKSRQVPHIERGSTANVATTGATVVLPGKEAPLA